MGENDNHVNSHQVQTTLSPTKDTSVDFLESTALATLRAPVIPISQTLENSAGKVQMSIRSGWWFSGVTAGAGSRVPFLQG